MNEYCLKWRKEALIKRKKSLKKGQGKSKGEQKKNGVCEEKVVNKLGIVIEKFRPISYEMS